MKRKAVHVEYILYCDESIQTGPIYSGFFGGCVISAKDWQHVSDILNAKKIELNLYGEVKWQKVTENYLNKYTELMIYFFSFIKTGVVKLRIIFHSNTDEFLVNTIKPDTRYFRRYYQFVKNAFGLNHITSDKPVFLRIYLDSLPYSNKKRTELKKLLMDLPNSSGYTTSPIVIRSGDVTEVVSHEHVILQCLDIVLGSMHFKLNNLHRVLQEDSGRKGNRTVAKEKLYNHIISLINDIMPEFDISKTTAEYDDNIPECYWNHPYRHWRVV